jgi:PIN domain nuclease of toxin-antitoxin system
MGRELGLGLVSLGFDDFADVEALPFHYRDPFDRLLAVVAHRHQLPIISADAVFEQYGVKRVW